MQATIEKPVLKTGGSGDSIVPPNEVQQRNGDGEGDGRMIADGLAQAESFANRTAVVELGGLHLANTLRGVGRNAVQRRQFAIPTGRLTLQREIPLFLN